MARPSSGHVTERPWSDGKTITFGARIYAYGERHRLTFGTNTQGWNRTRAEIEIESIQQQVLRGTWEPPQTRTSIVQSRAEDLSGNESFGPFARRLVESKKSYGLDEDTIADIEWKLGYLVSYFGRMPLLEIGVAETDIFRDELAKALPGDPQDDRARQAADGNGDRQVGQNIQTPQEAAVQHVDQRDPGVAQPDPATRR